MSKDLRQFLQVAKEAGPDFYVEVNRPLKPKLEVCVLQEKLAKEGRKFVEHLGLEHYYKRMLDLYKSIL